MKPNLATIFSNTTIKLAALITLVLQTPLSYGQFNSINGIWVSKNEDTLVIDNPYRLEYCYLSSQNKKGKYLSAEFYGEIISLREKNKMAARPGINKYEFKIISRTDTTMDLKPISILSRKYFNNRTIIKFTALSNYSDKSIKFEKLVFHYQESWMPNRIELEIDNKGNLNLFWDGYDTKIKMMVQEKYTSVLNDSIYADLIDYLQTCNLKTLRFEPFTDMKDSDDITLTVYFNGKRKYLHSNDPPTMSLPLVYFLRSLKELPGLNRVEPKPPLEK